MSKAFSSQNVVLKFPEVLPMSLDKVLPMSVLTGEGGPYGMALLAAYMLYRAPGESLADYLDNKVFADAKAVTVTAESADVEGFNSFLTRYKQAFSLEKIATEVL